MKKKLHAFSTPKLLGSPQILSFVPTESMIENAPDDMLPNIDYSVVYFDGNKAVQVRWYNHLSSIQFCGSAAYAMSYYLLKTYGLSDLIINSTHIKLYAQQAEKISLFVPARVIIRYSKQPFQNGCLYHHDESDIYFLEVTTKKTIEEINWTQAAIEALPLDNPHGLCVFYWEKLSKTGYLRYFTPWHGRLEDSVTGSIQSYLTCFVAHQYAVASQTWIQLSKNGGRIHTNFMKETVSLEGDCIELPTLYK